MRRIAVVLCALAALSCESSVQGLTGVTPGNLPATQLVITSQPSSEAINTAINPAVQVAVRSANGQTNSQSTATITVTITPNTGTAGAVLSGTTSGAAANGVALFNNLRINLAGSGYTLTFSAPGLTSAVSTPFDITP